MISLKIDVSKIDKSKLFKGSKGVYLDAVMFETPDNQYGDDYMIVQSVSKEEREKGIKGEILGNGKVFGQREQNPNPGDYPEAEGNEGNDDLPF